MSKIQLEVVKSPKKNEQNGLFEGYFCDYYFRAKLTPQSDAKNIKSGRLAYATIYKDACYYNRLNLPRGRRGVLFEINSFYNPDFYQHQLKLQNKNQYLGLFMKIDAEDLIFLNDFVEQINKWEDIS